MGFVQIVGSASLGLGLSLIIQIGLILLVGVLLVVALLKCCMKQIDQI